MVDPISLGVLGTLAATEGVKFLYGQAAEVLKRRRERKEGKEEAAREPIKAEGGADVLEGKLAPPKIDFEKLEQVGDDLTELTQALANYANEIEKPDPADPAFAETADAVRRALETIYGQRITFKGEDREPSGPVVIGHAEAEKVAGDLAGVRARLVKSGRVEGTAKAGEVPEGGTVTGADVDTVGGS